MKRIITFLFLTMFATVVYADKYDDWFKQVSALVTEQEKADFKRLKTEAEKEKFMKDFWAKRDSSPQTSENEYKTNFETNSQKVDERIKGKRRKGHETDMGHALLLLGPPAEQKTVGEPAAGVSEDQEGGSASQKQIWTYRGLPSAIASGDVVIEFVPDPNMGEWKFADKKKTQDILEKAREQVILTAQAAGHAAQEPPPQAPPPPTTMKEEAPVVTTPALKAALDASATGTPPKDVGFHSLVDSFMTSEKETFATFAVGADPSLQNAKVGIRLLDASGAPVKEAEFPFPTAGEAPGFFQNKLPVGSGEYTAVVAIASGDKTGGAKHTLKVGDNSKLALSSLILSKKFSQLAEAKPEKEPYTFGKIKVDPTVDRAFTRASDDLIIVYEVYNFQKDAAGNANLEVSISFQGDKGKPINIPAAAPKGLVTGNKMTVPTSFKLSEFPATFTGKQKVLVTVKDLSNQQTVTSESTFTVS